MNVPTKLAAFGALLTTAFTTAALAGAAVDPTDSEEAAMSTHADTDETRPATGHGAGDMASERNGGHGGHGVRAADAPAAGGLAVSHGGYTLEPDRTHFETGQPTRFSFRITDARGRVVRDEFQSEHERELHLIVVRRDTAIYQHVHPRKHADGTWSVELELPEPGVYRAYADFQIGGESHTLATDLFAPGGFRPEPLPEPAAADEAEGYDVELRGSPGRAGRESELTFAVTRDGQAVPDLEDYLGARGHLVALREGDPAYLHVHPLGGDEHAAPAEAGEHYGDEHAAGEEAASNEIRFAATFPTAGRYRLFLQFKIDGEVRTVAYTVEVAR